MIVMPPHNNYSRHVWFTNRKKATHTQSPTYEKDKVAYSIKTKIMLNSTHSLTFDRTSSNNAFTEREKVKT